MPGRKAQRIELTEDQLGHLQQRCRRPKSPQAQVKRAGIILKANEGLTNQAISEALDVPRITVRTWPKRWAEAGVALSELAEEAEAKDGLAALVWVLSDN